MSAPTAPREGEAATMREVFSRQIRSLEDARPLCPDCRDKQRGKDCLGCTIQSLYDRVRHLEGLLVRRHEAEVRYDTALALSDRAHWREELFRIGEALMREGRQIAERMEREKKEKEVKG